jgi:two-component system sensor histidine kinase AtoS
MKKKLIIGLGIFALIFSVGGVFAILTIKKTTSTLTNLITLHQVEMSREHLLLKIKKVQSDLALKNTRYAKGTDAIISDAMDMDNAIRRCFDCHHKNDIKQRLVFLRKQIEDYRDALSRIITIRADVKRMELEEDNALKIGEGLITEVNNMIVATTVGLGQKTQIVLDSLNKTNTVIFVLIALGPILTTALAVIIIKEYSGPIGVLLHATRKLKEGNLDHRITGLKDEFGELAESFNEMSHSLKEYWSKLEESERKYRLLFESAKDAVFLLDAERDYGRIIDANPAAAEMHGYCRNELLNLNRRDLLVPDHAKRFDERFKKAMQDERFVAESLHIKKDGTVFPVEVNASLVDIDGHRYFLTFDRDITERKQAEERLLRTEQMKLCGEMAASLAHEIKNPLAGIMASIEVLHDELNITEDDRMVMKTIIEEIRRIESLLNELLIFARPVSPQMITVNVNNIIESMLTMQASAKNREIKVVKNLDALLPDIFADPMQIKQALLNLYTNAVEAMPHGGTVSIMTSADKHKGMVLIEISDTGVGIAEDVKEKIFQPFFSTKPKGTGLGLAITKQIIEKHGGTINVSSSKGRGTVFTISLPLNNSVFLSDGE